MDAQEYITKIVEPTIKDFEENPVSVRHAFLACVVVFHSIDYLGGSKSTSQLRQKFRKASKDFALIDRIAHALKHVKTGHEASKDIQPLAASEVILRPPAFWGVAVWGLSRWNDSTGGVTIKTEVELDIMGAVKNALEFVRNQIPN
jgi:hypothetical protein